MRRYVEVNSYSFCMYVYPLYIYIQNGIYTQSRLRYSTQSVIPKFVYIPQCGTVVDLADVYIVR